MEENCTCCVLWDFRANKFDFFEFYFLSKIDFSAREGEQIEFGLCMFMKQINKNHPYYFFPKFFINFYHTQIDYNIMSYLQLLVAKIFIEKVILNLKYQICGIDYLSRFPSNSNLSFHFNERISCTSWHILFSCLACTCVSKCKTSRDKNNQEKYI